MFGDLPAGFALSLVAKGVASRVNYVARLDGATQSWEFSTPIQFTSSQDVEIRVKVIPEIATTQVIFGSGSSPERFYVGTENGNWLVGNGTDRVVTSSPVSDGTSSLILKTVSGVLTLTVNSVVVYNQPIKYSTDKSLTGLSNMTGFRFMGAIYDFNMYLDDVLVSRIPLTNKAQGANQLATFGNVNAFMPNYTEAVWEEV